MGNFKSVLPGWGRDPNFNIVSVCHGLASGLYENVVVMIGPGACTSPERHEYRSQMEGFYGLVEQKYDMRDPEGVLDVWSFEDDPRPFYIMLKEIYDTNVDRADVTYVHKFLKLLHDKGLLKRVYTSNINSLELRTGLPKSKVIECYGNLRTSHCINPSCRTKFDFQWLHDFLQNGNFDPESGHISLPFCPLCKSFVKPDVVLLGESSPREFYQYQEEDFTECDLLLVIGTKLKQEPFNELVKICDVNVPRLYINNSRPHGYKSDIDDVLQCCYPDDSDIAFTRKRDIVISHHKIQYVIGDMCNYLRWMKDLKAN